jgi:hypothetical protein
MISGILMQCNMILQLQLMNLKYSSFFEIPLCYFGHYYAIDTRINSCYPPAICDLTIRNDKCDRYANYPQLIINQCEYISKYHIALHIVHLLCIYQK